LREGVGFGGGEALEEALGIGDDEGVGVIGGVARGFEEGLDMEPEEIEKGDGEGED